MAGTAYHMEALRKQRVIERKMQALKNLEDSIGQADGIDSREDSKQSDVLAFAEIGQYQQARHNHWRIGRERDRKQYDHSRDGPIVDRTRYALKREFGFLGSSLSMLKDDIRPEHKPIPTCRRF